MASNLGEKNCKAAEVRILQCIERGLIQNLFRWVDGIGASLKSDDVEVSVAMEKHKTNDKCSRISNENSIRIWIVTLKKRNAHKKIKIYDFN